MVTEKEGSQDAIKKAKNDQTKVFWEADERASELLETQDRQFRKEENHGRGQEEERSRRGVREAKAGILEAKEP